MKAYDLVIVGAGFAGLACAETAARHNLKTLVLERKHDMGGHIQTTGILVREIAEAWDVPQRLTRKISGVRLYGPSLDWIDLSSPGYYFLATDTPALMRWQARQAEAAGAKIILDSAYVSSHYRNGRHYLEPGVTRCRFLAGCDGARSRVAKHYHLGRNRRFLIGVEAIYAGPADIDQDKLHVFLDAELAPGYIGWVVPGIQCTQVGLAMKFPVAPRLQEFIRKISPVLNLQDLQPISHRAGVIPCGGPVRNWSDENVLLLGDAAGMASPLTAGGIHPALLGGRLAGEAIAHYLDHGSEHPGLLLGEKIPQVFFKKILRTLCHNATVPNALLDTMLKRPLFQAFAQALFFHHRGLLSTETWRDLIRIFNPPQ
ncbi:MAG: NAD(P)/FAD-dependent oxidoreductase [Gammaproteobacteria bacterium]